MQKYHFSDITEFNKFIEEPPPEHPMMGFLTHSPGDKHANVFTTGEPLAISTDFYIITFKKIIAGEIQYGRTRYDYKNGMMMFIGPRQEIISKGIETESKGYNLFFHEDFIKGHEIRNRIRKYSFFSYSTNEALHLSPREEKLMENILENIDAEYNTNPDEFSRDIILAHIDAMLKYANRYYKRQFINRKDLSGGVYSNFEDVLADYFAEGRFEYEGVPRIEEIAGKLEMSPRYLSDSLKTETGKSAIDHIHLYLMDEAKNLLLEPNTTVSETAYKLGFEYPHYFSRLFKKKTGLNPTEYQRKHLIHR
jgi:AraC-like DNA-binding protein